MPGLADADDDAGSFSSASASSRDDSAPGDHAASSSSPGNHDATADDAAADHDAFPDGNGDSHSHCSGRLRLGDPRVRRRGLRRLGPARRSHRESFRSFVCYVSSMRRFRELRERHGLPLRPRLQPDSPLLRLELQLRVPLRAFSGTFSSSFAAAEHAHAVAAGANTSSSSSLASVASFEFLGVAVLSLQGCRDQHEL